MLEAKEMFLAAAPDRQPQINRKRVHDRNAHAVQTARHLVGILVEFSTRMELGHDDLRRRHALFFMDLDRDAAAIVNHRHRTIGIQRDLNLVAISGQRFINGVIHDFADHMMQPRAVIGITNIHARALANRIEAFEDLDRIRAIIAVAITLAGR